MTSVLNAITYAKPSKTQSTCSRFQQTDSESDFSTAVSNAAKSGEADEKVVPKQPEASPSEIYEEMQTGTAARAEAVKSRAEAEAEAEDDGMFWNDEKLAKMISLANGANGGKIDTTKQINWNATGKNELTSKQIADLKSKYDMGHLDPQSYYNLLSDLTNADVISASDVTNLFVTKAYLPQKSMLVRTDTAPQSRFGPHWMGNIRTNLGMDAEYDKWLSDYMKTEEFAKLNPSYTKEDIEGGIEFYQNQADYYDKMSGIFGQLM